MSKLAFAYVLNLINVSFDVVSLVISSQLDWSTDSWIVIVICWIDVIGRSLIDFDILRTFMDDTRRHAAVWKLQWSSALWKERSSAPSICSLPLRLNCQNSSLSSLSQSACYFSSFFISSIRSTPLAFFGGTLTVSLYANWSICVFSMLFYSLAVSRGVLVTNKIEIFLHFVSHLLTIS